MSECSITIWNLTWQFPLSVKAQGNFCLFDKQNQIILAGLSFPAFQNISSVSRGTSEGWNFFPQDQVRKSAKATSVL